MFGNGKLAARSTLTAGLAGLVMLTAAPALAAAQPAPAARPESAAGAPAATGSFKTWRAAQRAAGFRLRAATRTYGLKRTHPIQVGRCEATGKLRKRDVFAEWDGSNSRYMSIDQNNSGQPCSNFGAAKPLGTYRIRGHKAHLFGFCGVKGLPSCHRRNIVLVLAWRAGKKYYVTYSNNEWRSTLAGFARSLRRV